MNFREYLGIWAFSLMMTAAVVGWIFLCVEVIFSNEWVGGTIGLGVPLVALFLLGMFGMVDR